MQDHRATTVYRLFVWSVGPAYFLSALWLPLPVFVYALIVLAALAQTIGYVLLVAPLIRSGVQIQIVPSVRRLFLFAAIATAIKLLLQLLSVIPKLSVLAFGFRAVVIGYLHLVLLGCISLFLIAYLLQTAVSPTRKVFVAVYMFIAGVILNEFVLMLQGLSGFAGILIPYTSEALFVVALVMVAGLLLWYIFLHRNNAFADFNHIPETEDNRALP